MRWLLFLNRVAFICNVCFLIAASLLVFNWIGNEQLSSTIVIMGYFLALMFNPIAIFAVLVVLILKRSAIQVIPLWLIIINVVFLFAQLVFIIFLNDFRDPQG